MSNYIPPSIRTIREDIQQSTVIAGGQVVPAFIGTANGQALPVGAKQFSLGASPTFSIPNLAPLGPVDSIVQIRSLPAGGIIYTSGVDYTFNKNAQTIVWASVNLAAPYILTANVGTGGSIAAGNKYYVVTATRTLDITGPSVGETAASNEILAVIPTGGAGKVTLAWQQVAGAEGYKVYVTSSQGNYSGSHLLTTITGGYTTSYVDDGSVSPSAGSPPGLAAAGSVTSANAETYSLTPGQTLVVKINGAGAVTATFTAVAGQVTDAATYPVTISASATLTIRIDGGPVQTITFAGTETTAADVSGVINAQLSGASANVVSGHVRITSDKKGTGSSVNVTGGSANATLLFTTGAQNGSGNVANIAAVTAAEVVAVLNPVTNTGPTGATASATSGRVTLTANTTGTGGSVQFDPAASPAGGSANTAIGFDTTLHSGNSASTSTALRRPALNGTSNSTADKFYVDYNYLSTKNFQIQSFTNLGLALNAFGLGTNLSVAITLAMGTSGRGNNASQVLAMSIPDDNLNTYQAALDIFSRRRDVDLIVPCNSEVPVQTALKAHVDFTSNVDNKRERIGVVGPKKGVVVGDADTSGTAVFMARALSDQRMIFLYPWPFVDVQQADLSIVNTEMDGWASAAAYAGLTASLADRAEPATTKQMFGITSLGGQELDEITMNILGGNGVTVLTVEDGQLIVRDSLTTQTVRDSDRHPSIILAEDLLRKNLRTNFREFRGRKLLPNLLTQIEKRTARILQQLVKLTLIAGYDPQSISAVQDPDNLTFIIVRFSYRPIFPVRVIEFRYSFDLTTAQLAA